MRSLITGGFGFAGRHLARHLKSEGDSVIGTFLVPEEVTQECEAVKLNVASFDECRDVIKNAAPEVIYHLAGVAFAPDAAKNFSQALSVNVGGTYNVLRACEELKLNTKVVAVSSSEVYGYVNASDLPIKETTIPKPSHSYSLSKALSEVVLERFQGKVDYVLIRPFNHIGPGQRPDFVVSSFARQIARAAAGKGEPKVRVGNLSAERDFTDVRDIVRGYRLAALKGEGIFNLCSGMHFNIGDILHKLIALSGMTITVETDPERVRASELPVFYGSYEKAKTLLGWSPVIPLETSLSDIFHYWKEVAERE